MRWRINSAGIIVILFGLLSSGFLGYGQSCEENINRMNALYKDGKISEAIEVAEKALPGCKIELGVMDNSLFLSNLGFLYEKQGNYFRAETLLIDALEQTRKVVGEAHPDYITSLLNLAGLYQTQNLFIKAEPLYLNVLEIIKNAFGKKYPSYITATNNLALLYFDQGNYPKAESLYQEGIEITKIIYGEHHPSYAVELNNLAGVYKEQADYSKAEVLYLQALEILEVGDLNYFASLNNLAGLYSLQGYYEKAEQLYLNALELIKKAPDTEPSDVATLFNNVALLYVNQGKYAKAEPLYIRSIEIAKNTLGEDNPGYATSLENLAGLYDDQGDYTHAEPLYLKTLELRKKILGENHPDYTISLNNLALVYQNQGEYSKAESFYLRAIETTKNLLGERHPNYATSLTNLGVLYVLEGSYLKAEPLYLKALEIRKQLFGEDHRDYANSLNSIAAMYQVQGNYSKAEPLYLKALEIRKKVLGEDHHEFATSLSNLGGFYYACGNYSKAETLFKRALIIIKKSFGEEHHNYATVLNNLSLLYQKEGFYKKAETGYLKILNTYKDLLGIQHPRYVTSLSNLGTLYNEEGNYSKAEQLNIEVLIRTENIFGKNHFSYAKALNNLAATYENQGNYSSAEKLYLEALDITKKLLGENHPDYTTSLGNLALLYQNQGSYNKSKIYLKELLPLEKKQILQQTTFQTISELSDYLNTNRFDFIDGKFSLLYPFKITNDTINRELFNTAILLKNLTLRNSTQTQTRIKERKDTALINTLEEFQSLKRQLNKYATLPKAEQPKEINELEERANTLEKKLVTGSQAFKQDRDFTNTTWKNVQQSLKKDEAAIEFVSFRYLSKQWTDSVLYAAMVIRRGYSFPKIIPLFEQRQLDSLLKRNPSLPEENYLNNLYDKNNSALYNLIVKPIDSLLQGVNTIYTAPSGSLYYINLARVMSNKPDGGTFNIHILGTTGEIPRYSALHINQSTISNAMIFGGINYDTASASGISFQPPVYTPGFEQVASVTNRGGAHSWSYLPGTLAEAQQVEDIHTQAGIKVTLLKGNDANETSFKNLNGFSSPYVLHLATHGYFFPNPVQEKPKDFGWQGKEEKLVYKWSEDPLLRSGLILAGANKAWKNSALITDSTEDGILTSMEVVNVDLSNCKLAVLSACETGLGDINGSEGVFGLQRGFKLAGVKNIIMSLWKIPDVQSAELLTLFYKNCFSGLPVYDALKQAQQVMSEKYPAYYWAGFVLLE